MRRQRRPRSLKTGSVALLASRVGPRPVSVSGGLCAQVAPCVETARTQEWQEVRGGMVLEPDGDGTAALHCRRSVVNVHIVLLLFFFVVVDSHPKPPPTHTHTHTTTTALIVQYLLQRRK